MAVGTIRDFTPVVSLEGNVFLLSNIGSFGAFSRKMFLNITHLIECKLLHSVMLWRYCAVNKPCWLFAAQAQFISIPFDRQKGKIHVI